MRQEKRKDAFQQSTNYPQLPNFTNTLQQSPGSLSISESKEFIFQSKSIIIGYVNKVFNQIKNHAVRFEISRINSSYTRKAIEKEGVYNLSSFVQNLVVFYKKSIQNHQSIGESIQDIIAFINDIRKELGRSKEELQSDSEAVKNVQRINHIVASTFGKLVDCFEIRNLGLTDYMKYAQIAKCLIGEIKEMIDGDNFILRIGCYDPYSLPTIAPVSDPFAETVKSPKSYLTIKSQQYLMSSSPHYFPKERILFDQELTPQAINEIYPQHHRVYICEASKAYSPIAPIRINKINIDRFPRFQNFDTIFDISNDNYFQGEDTLPILYHLIPQTNKMSFYNLSVLHDALNLTYQHEEMKEMPIQGTFSEYTQSCISPYGSIFLTNVSTTNKHHDLNFWQYKFSTSQIKKRIPIPSGRKQHGMIFLNNFIFLIGGSSSTSKAMKSVQKYNIKNKQWTQAGSMHIGVTNPTVCTFRNRYIFSCCGFNEFDFISNRFQMYDSIYDGWTIVKTVTNNQFKNLQLLNGGSAVAINPEVIYIFGGNRSTGFQHDTDVALLVNEVVEVKKKPSRVEAELIPTGGEKRALLSYAGVFKPNSGVLHNNSLYFLRKDIY